MVRQDQVRLVADDEPIADGDASRRELVDLGKQRLRIDHDAVADDAGDALVQDAGRQQPQHELAPVGVDGVTGVVAALIPRDDRKIRRQQIDDLALALVSPLRAQYSDVHMSESRSILQANSAASPTTSRERSQSAGFR